MKRYEEANGDFPGGKRVRTPFIGFPQKGVFGVIKTQFDLFYFGGGPGFGKLKTPGDKLFPRGERGAIFLSRSSGGSYDLKGEGGPLRQLLEIENLSFPLFKIFSLYFPILSFKHKIFYLKLGVEAIIIIMGVFFFNGFPVYLFCLFFSS